MEEPRNIARLADAARARARRVALVHGISRRLGPFDERHLRAIQEVPRERFVRPEDLALSADDVPLALDATGQATISAPHAYCLSFRLLELTAGDSLVELGTGSGYGAALAAYIVGPRGRVATFEIDPRLAAWARATLAELPLEAQVTAIEGDAMTAACRWGNALKVVVTFAVGGWPAAWLDALPETGRIVAPIGDPRETEQRLVLATRRSGRIVESDHGAVRYVRNRSTLEPGAVYPRA